MGEILIHRKAMLVLLAMLTAALSAFACAQDAWPTKPIHLIVPFPAGGQLDVVSRLIGDRLATRLGQAVIVEVKPGADGNIGTELASRAAPDGYTWLAVSPPTTIQPSVRPKTLRYDPLRDFAPIALIGTSPFVFVVPATLGVNTLDEFVAYAKAHPDKLSYAGSSRGTVVHLSSELLKHDTGIDMQMIGYQGQPSAIADLLTGRVQFMTLGLILAEPHIKTGQLKGLAILDPARHPHLPAVPSVVELGHPDLVMSTWFGLAAPRQTPKPIIDRINAEVMAILRMPDIVDKLAATGVDSAKPNTPAQFAEFMANDVKRWQKVVADAGISLD
jgi:tripartite-type tricarboxylate transporter receptor subunit TctC